MTNFTDLQVDPKTPGYNANTVPEIKLAVIANVWIKLMTFKKAGDYAPGHKHTFNHPSLLSAGSVVVEVDNNKKTFRAPAIIYIEKDKEHSIIALEPNTVVSCIHALRSGNETDDIISEDMLPAGISPLGLFQNTEYNLTSIIK
jgi:quercetin dioxygenase-like cupin family protein